MKDKIKGRLIFFPTNINALSSAQRRKIIFKQLQKVPAEIICLQETHIRWTELKTLEQKKIRDTVCCSGCIKKRERGGNICQRMGMPQNDIRSRRW